MLQSDMLPQIAGRAPEGKQFYFLQDLAAAHTANRTLDLLMQEGAPMAPGFPRSADVRPLYIHVNPELRRRLRVKDLGDYTQSQKRMCTHRG